MKKIPRNVFILGLVSFFNDTASEMIYPLIPLFLTSVLKTSIPMVGIIEGIAEATASITKYLFGSLSDYFKKRKIFVVLGYSFGAISKLLIGLATAWPFVLIARLAGRSGKGLRTAPRDSLLLENTNEKNRSYIFGFHRAFDSLGAVIGPLIALLLIYLLKDNLRMVFYLAFIPSFIGVILLVILIKEKKYPVSEKKQFVKINIKNLNPQFKLFLFISIIFALGNSSDAFLILRAKNLGLSALFVTLTYVLYNISQVLFSTKAGRLADKIGPKKVYSYGLVIFSIVYFFFGFIKNPLTLWILFPIYGLYIAFTDGISKAYLSQFIDKKESGSYFGLYQMLIAIATFFASTIGGILWQKINPSSTFYYGSSMALVAFFILTFSRKSLSQN